MSIKNSFLLIFSLVLILVLSVVVYLLTRPASVEIFVYPPDSQIKLDNFKPSVGTLYLPEVKSGTYKAEVFRQGYKKLSFKIQLKRGEKFQKRVELEPDLIPCSFQTLPVKSNFQVFLSTGKNFKGKTPWKGKLPAGYTKVVFSKAGYRPFSKTFLIEKPVNFKTWLDPAGQVLHCLNIFKCGGSPKGVSFTPDNQEIWVTLLGNQPAIRVFNPFKGKKKADIYLGKHGAVEITFSSDGKKAYTSQMETASVYEIYTLTKKVNRVFKTGSSWSKVVVLSANNKTLYVSNWCGNDVSEIDLISGKLKRRLPAVKTPRGLYLTPDEKYLYVAGFGKGEIEKINLKTGKRKLIFSQGSAVRHLAADEKRKVLYASDLGKDCIWKVDLKTDRVTLFARTDSKPNTIDLTPDGKVLFVSCRGANNPKSYYLPGPEWGSVLVFDTATGKPLDAVTGGNQCTALDVSSDGKFLIFSDFLDGTLRLYQIPAYEKLIKGNSGRYRTHFKDLRKSN